MMLPRLLLWGLAFSCGSLSLSAESLNDVEYAKVNGQSLKLDLHLSTNKGQPLLVFVHGGAWRGGSKETPPILALQKQGFAIASVEYRLTTVAPFPANIHDIKAAIRFLRAKAPVYGYDAARVGIIGVSAGGHLAALVGMTNGDKPLEGPVGDHLDQKSDVQCVISLFGASNLQTILSQSTEQGLKMRVPALQLLLGGQPDEKPELTKQASPVAHLDKKDPPLFLMHGDADPQMPYQQAQEFAQAYEAIGLPVQFVTIPGGRHGSGEFFDQQSIGLMATFLHAHLDPP